MKITIPEWTVSQHGMCNHPQKGLDRRGGGINGTAGGECGGRGGDGTAAGRAVDTT